ncbi:Intermediate cleaving peptidase 55 [Chlorella vulgaris]
MAANPGALRRAAARFVAATQSAESLRAAALAGQPTPLTHPELLQPGELLPGVPAAEFAARRDRLAALLPPGGIAVLPAAPLVYMSGVIPYPYRQSADFLYLTGITQPYAVAAVDSSRRFSLFVADPDAWREQWDGARLGPVAAAEVFGAHEAFPISQLPSRLGSMLGEASAVLYDAESKDPCAVLHLPAFQAAAARHCLQPLRPLMHKLRWRKSAAELALLRRSAKLAAAAMAGCIQQSHPGVHEHLLAASFEHTCKAGGAQRMAYPPVVAGGADACTIHYSRNDKPVPGDHMVLLDGGCEYQGYCSDVTRTWPVGGKYSGAQRAVYEAVLSVHRACLAACKPGTTLRQLHHTSVRLLADALAQLGVQPGHSASDIMQGSYRRFYPHSVGHWLGLDTHDSSTMSHDRQMEPGVVLTIEPGLYIPDDPAFGHFRGIGVRIEDDVAITAAGHEVLSGDVPVGVEDIEQLVGSGLR